MSSLILGAATGYQPEQVAVFVESLRQTGFSGTLALFVNPANTALRDYLKRNEVEVVPVETPPRWMPGWLAERRFNHGRIGFLHRTLAGARRFVPGPLRASYDAHCVAPFHHIVNARYSLYRRYLLANARRFSHVLLSDVRDVAFQADPFKDLPPRCLWVFQENRDVCIRDDFPNSCWVKIAYGERGIEEFGHRGILCAGTTLGSTDLCLRYLEIMAAEMTRLLPLIAGEFMDQAIHNCLVWTDRIPECEVKQNFSGPAANLHLEPLDRFRFDDAGRLLNSDGSPIAVLHQFDRHETLTEKVAGRLSAGRTP